MDLPNTVQPLGVALGPIRRQDGTRGLGQLPSAQSLESRAQERRESEGWEKMMENVVGRKQKQQDKKVDGLKPNEDDEDFRELCRKKILLIHSF